ncbi:hypothetical protein [Rhodococcus sp. 114MFTsu3.1]|uniref:hypothetical protein n=1 Tax=Rhodococcus sp. 114MFTsu3.1 TaxID=1172184 RepID=UPI00036C73D3|nr:hypothetical protein [Rhodococcus sp. 114MFTsu3.1]
MTDQPTGGIVVLDAENNPVAVTTKDAVASDAFRLAFNVMDEASFADSCELVRATMSGSPDVFPFTASYAIAVLGNCVVGNLIEQLAELGVQKSDAIARVGDSINRLSIGGDC